VAELGLVVGVDDEHGEVHGGPMHYIERGLGPSWKWLAAFYAFACMVSAVGAGNMFQTNQVASILRSSFSVPAWVSGALLAFFTGVVIIGGVKRIGAVTSKLVPFMGIIYAAGALVVIAIEFDRVPAMLSMIFHDAFRGTAAFGAFTGIAVRTVIVQGVRRACFSNEAGMGSAAIAHSAAVTKEPVREGVVALLEPFIDTVLICTMTAVVILLSGAWTSDLNGVQLTVVAFDTAIPGFGRFFVPVAVALFAYSTLLSWSYYGGRAVDYLWGEKAVTPYKVIFCVFAFIGAIWKIDPVVNFSDLFFGLLAVPNLIGIWLLFPGLKTDTADYFRRFRAGKFTPR